MLYGESHIQGSEWILPADSTLRMWHDFQYASNHSFSHEPLSHSNTDNNMTETWCPPTVSTGKIPRVTPGSSEGLVIEGDYPLDQIVISRQSMVRSSESEQV